MVDPISCPGFCSSYDEVKVFELHVTFDQKPDLVEVGPDSCIQLVADNVEHYIRILYGTGTFHGMGIAAATPGSKVSEPVRRDPHATPEKVSAIGKIPSYFHPSAVDLTLAYDVLKEFRIDDKAWTLDLIWKRSWPLRSPRP